ncbi:glycosyl transferase [Clostridia bacterium]|nr:glycosyl transferase [Clostridia bacterium]
MIKISIITICYNAEDVIEKTMRSILSQTYESIEYILVDGDSIDRTNMIIEHMRYAFEEKGIVFKHISEKDDGISDAFNKGIKLSTGEIVGIINAGDQLANNSLNLVSDSFTESFDILYGNVLWDDRANNLTYIRKSKRDWKSCVYDMSALHPAIFIKKRAYNRIGYYRKDYKICMDKELLVKMYYCGLKFKFVDNVLAVMDAGGVSDNAERNAIYISESIMIALDNGIPKHRIVMFLKYQNVRNSFKRWLKKNTSFYKNYVNRQFICF